MTQGGHDDGDCTPKSGDGLYYERTRGKDVGLRLTPWVDADGSNFVVSRTRFEVDYVRVPPTDALTPWLIKGYNLRMGAPGISPSLISPESIEGFVQ